MGMQSILALFNGGDGELGALQAAFGLAQRFTGHVRCLHLSPDPVGYAGIYGEGMLANAAIAEAVEKDSAERRARAEAHFTRLAAQYGVEIAAALPLHHASASFQQRAGQVEAAMAQEGRLCDIAVIARDATQSALYEQALNAALFSTARPVLMVPATPPAAPERTVLVAWDGSREAAAALHAALPLLALSEKVHVVTARKSREAADFEADTRLMRYLSLHGIAPAHHIVEKTGRDAGETILSKAAEVGATLLVMGAYGHSRFREMVLGGATEHALRHATMPVLLAH